MKSGNPLTIEFLSQHGADAARVLESMPAEHVALFLLDLPVTVRSPVITAMLPGKMANIIESLSEERIPEILDGISLVVIVRILRILPALKRRSLIERLPERLQRQIKRHLKFPQTSIGSLMESSLETLPLNITVAEALKRISRFNRDPEGGIYIIDEMHRLVGVIDAGRLIRANQRVKLSSVMQTRFPKLSASAEISTLVKHPGWKVTRKMPVIDRDKTLLGFVDNQKIQSMDLSSYGSGPPNPVENLISLAAFYWVSAAQLLVGIFSVVTKGQEVKR